MKLPTVTIRKEILEAWLRVSGCSRAQLSRHLGVTKGRVSQLLHNDTEPSAHLIAKLLVLTELPFERLFDVRRLPAKPAQPRSTRPARAQTEAVPA
jgi:transcriptional regulator with XRE-family HTH domain